MVEIHITYSIELMGVIMIFLGCVVQFWTQFHPLSYTLVITGIVILFGGMVATLILERHNKKNPIVSSISSRPENNNFARTLV